MSVHCTYTGPVDLKWGCYIWRIFCPVSFRVLIHFVSRIFCVIENHYVHTAKNFSLSGLKLTNLGEFSWFLYHEAGMGRRLWDYIKNSKLFRFGLDFKVFSAKNFFFWWGGRWARSKIKNCLWLLLYPFASFQNDFLKIFTLWEFLTCFKIVEKLWLFTACSACIDIF